MTYRLTRCCSLAGTALMLSVLLGPATSAMAASAIIDTVAGYEANDRWTSMYPGGQDVYGDDVAVYHDSELWIYDRVGSSGTVNLGAPGGYSGWNSFVTYNVSGDSIWVGFTVSGNTDDRIYEVTNLGGGGTWTHQATLACNFDVAFSGGNPYVSSVNDPTWMAPNSIWLLDTSGSNNHDKIAEVTGNSAGLDFDSFGDLYYGTYTSPSNSLIRYTAAQVSGAVGVGHLALADAETLSSLASGAYDTEVDGAGNVMLTSGGSTLLMWNGTAGTGNNCDTIGTGAGAGWHWFGMISATGDVTQIGGGAAYLADGWYCPGLAEIRAVPEPSTIAMVASGLLVLFICWRRRRRV